MAKKRAARDIMKAPVIIVKEDMLVTEVLGLMARWHISGMPVVDDDGKLVGMVTGRLVMNNAIGGNAARTKVSEVMSKQMEIYGPACDLDTPVEEIVNTFATSRINRVLVVDTGNVLEIITRLEIICELNRIYSQFVTKD
ncbi:MAG: CBS domain-containing protein [Dehalococcoidia bacterium]|nr:MAG: CBS domain-containing protein [Dehalococcoidia bacterium]